MTTLSCLIASGALAHALNNLDKQNNNLDNNLEELRIRVRGYVNDAIRNLMPEEQKKAYLEALSKAPEVVEKETDPMQFVRFAKYDVWSGAERLCLYWTERLKIFGPEKAFLPLTLTGEGALTHDDILSLLAGYPAFLPDTCNGKRAILFDRRKWLPKATEESRLRCLFYVFRILAEDDRTQVDGVVALSVLATPRHQDVQWTWLHRSLSLITSIFPIKFTVHLLSIPHQKKPHLVRNVMNMGLQVPLQYFKTDVHMHVQHQPGQILEELMDAGLTREGIPLSFGGEWKIEDFFKWCQRQQESELISYGHGQQPPPEGCDTHGNEIHAIGTSCGNSAQSSLEGTKKRKHVSTLGGPEITEEEKLAKRRMADLLHSRRKRERKHEEIISLKDESASLIREHRHLRAECSRLESLLSQAKEMVHDIEQQSEQQQQSD